MGTHILLVGDGRDVVCLAGHLDACGYAVAYTSPEEVVGVMQSIRPVTVMVMPGVPDWQKRQICSAIKQRYPEPRIVLLRRTPSFQSGSRRLD